MAYAQHTVSGRVTSGADGMGLPGVSVRMKSDPTKGTVSDAEGNYQLQIPSGNATLIFSFTGFVPQEVAVNNRSQINVALGEDVKALEEVVVVGYGTQQKKLVTGATTQVSGEEIQKQSTTNALQALQGQAPGVQISSTSGQPGEGMRVLVRGLGTIGNSGPLYVVDGVLTSDISFLNPADIQSIDVLKDAASAAIYGSQAANGVVLITTRSGKAGQPTQITFDTYYGVQNVAKKHDMLNAREYASIMNEAMINSGKLPRFTNEEIAAMGEGTNWLDEMFVDNAVTQNYSFGAQGASEGSSFSTGLSYTSQEGIVGGKDLSFYERYNFRINTEHNLYKDVVKIGEHLTFAYINNNGIGVGNQYNNSLRGAFNTSPFVPMYDEEGNFWDNSGAAWTGGGEANPYAQMVYSNQNRRNSQRLLGDVYLSIEPIKNLKFRTSLGVDYSAGESRSFTPTYRLSIYNFNDFTRASQSLNKGRTLLWDNLLSYNFTLGQDHGFEAMIGSSAFQNDGSSIYGSNTNLIFNDLEHAWLSNATNADGVNISLTGAPYDQDRRMSYFGRLNYNYKEKYLLNTTFRADGSSRFAPNNRWGYFPSVSAGWVVSEEAFLQNSAEWLDYFKLRGSWGQVGSQNIPAFRYMAQVNFNNTNYTFGPGEGALVPGDALLTPGAFPSRLSNLDLQWETSEQTNFGFDAYLLNNKISVTFDWYSKITKDWLIEARVPATAGGLPPYVNGGDVRNTGVELALNYSDKIGEFNYSVGVNGAYNKNKVGQIPTTDGIIHGEINQLYDNSLEFYRAQNGYPIGYFWGLETAGIFQTEEEVGSYRSGEGRVIQPNARPGDVKFVDQNGDGIINDQDRVMIGNPNPEYTFGATLSANYKGFDISVLASGVAGNDIVQSYRNQANQFANYSASILDRWHGPGSSNTMPRVTEDNRNWTNFSDLYIHDGDFLRISNVTLGYDFGKLLNKGFIKQVRLYASVQNLYTFTRYNGMDPEIGYSIGFAQGVDLGYYPRPRTTMIGANIRF
ncbi:SusC/RagA family TonB-linked outer membrane protein [Pontibacter korlensis]|nr:TonB-dependent receptor [Pontibacter korlensis]